MTSNKVCLHDEGISTVSYDSNRQIVSTGHDISVVFYDTSLEADSYQFDVSRDGVDYLKDIACYHRRDKDYVAVATNKYGVLEYRYVSGNPKDDVNAESEFERILLRFTSDVNCLAVSPDSEYLAAGSSDFLIKVVNLDNEGLVFTLEGHEAPVLCIKFNDSLLGSSSCDGSFRVWSYKEKTQLCMINCMPKSNDVSLCPTLCRFAWNDNVLAVPTGGSVKLYRFSNGTTQWTQISTLEDPYHEMSINVCCWSPCGQYLSVGGADGHLTIWAYPSCSLLKKINISVNLLCSLAWDPNGADSAHPLIFSSSTGYIGSIPNHSIYKTGSEDIADKGSDDQIVDDSLLMEGIPPDSIFDDVDDILNASVNSPSKLPPPIRKRPLSPGSDATPSTTPRKRHNMIDDDIDDNDKVSIDGGESVAAPKSLSVGAEEGGVARVLPPVPAAEYHEIFQPSATPSHLSHRFMVYNVVGVVCCHSDHDSTPMIEVEFHDVSVHHSFSINNDNGWGMAALNTKGLILAKEKDDDNGSSQFQVTVFDSWDLDKDWTCYMPKGESVDVVAIGDSWVAVGTDKLFIRLYSLGGIQREVISCPGQLVTMSGCGQYLGVVYQETEVSLLSYWLLNVDAHTQVSPPQTLPLSNKAKLEWIGFSEHGLPLSYDNKGIVRAMSSQYGRSSWLPVMDCQKTLAVKSDHYFVVGLSHDPNLLRVILCKGLDYPPVHPRPVMTALPLSLPLCDHETEKSEIESKYIQSLFLQPLMGVKPTQTQLLQHLMEMLALACQSDLEYRGYEVAVMMKDGPGLDLALQYASKSGHYKLARHISSLKDQLSIDQTSYGDNTDNNMDDWYHEPAPPTTTSGRHGNRFNNVMMGSKSSHMTSRNSHHGNTVARKSTSRSLNTSSNDDIISIDNELHDKERSPTPQVQEEEDEEDGEELMDEGEDQENNGSQTNLLSTPNATPQLVTPSGKNNNPFRMTTPVSKKIQVARRSSFLEKLCKTVIEEEEEKKKKKERSAKAITESSGVKKKQLPKTTNKAKKKLENAKLSSFAFTKKE